MFNKLGLLGTSIQVIVPLLLNPLLWVGTVAGAFIGWGVCWVVFVLPFQKNLADREAQLDHWSKLNQQLQQQTMENRGMSQEELKQYVASNQEATVAFAEIQQRLQQRERRLSETPVYYVLLPLSVVVVGFGGVILLFKAMNQRALVTIDHVMELAPSDLVRAIARRHLGADGPRSGGLIAMEPSGGSSPKLNVLTADDQSGLTAGELKPGALRASGPENGPSETSA